MKYKNILIALFLSLFINVGIFPACKYSTIKKSYASYKTNESFDTIIRDIPLYVQQPTFKRMFIGFENGLGLAPLSNGVSGVEVRLWYTHDKTDTVQMLVIKNANSIWSANLFSAIYKLNMTKDSILSLSKTQIKKEPKYGWNVLIDSLFKLNISLLPDYTKLSGYEQNMGGDGILVEYADSKTYRIYSYPEPDFNKKEFIEAKMMSEILKLTADHLEFKWL